MAAELRQFVAAERRGPSDWRAAGLYLPRGVEDVAVHHVRQLPSFPFGRSATVVQTVPIACSSRAAVGVARRRTAQLPHLAENDIRRAPARQIHASQRHR